MDKYKSLCFIGEGSFGRVFRGENIDTKEIVALKFIPKRNKVDRELKILKGECDIQQGLFHPNIVRMIDYFETEGEVVAVSEYVPVQLFSKLKEYGKIPEFEVRQIACNLVSAIYYLHSLRILHRDIKPQNILLTSDGVAKLCDFGFSRKMGFDTYVLTSIKGTPLYMAPEVIKGRPYDQKVDLWSLGCILFELLTGKPPFNTTSIADLVYMIQTKSVIWPDYLSTNCSSFLQGLLQKDPNQRLGWPNILEHRWIKDRVVLLTTSLDNPLTSPLSSFQQKVKEEQKLQLMYKTALKTKPKIGGMVFEDINCNGQNMCLDQKHIKICNNQQNTVDLDAGNVTVAYHNIKSEATMWEDCEANDKIINQKHHLINEDCLEGKDEVNNQITNALLKPDKKNCSKLTHNYEPNYSDNGNQHEACPHGGHSYPDSDSDNLLGTDEIIHNMQTDFASFFVSEEKTIEKDEWARFLDKTLVEVLEHNFDIYFENSELSLFLSPIQSRSCPIIVVEKVISLLRIPFVLLEDTAELKAITKVYYDCKVLPNLVYAYADLQGESLCEENLDVISKIMTVLCYLCHTDKSFIYQLCDMVCILSVHDKIGALMGSIIDMDTKRTIIAILTQILRSAPEKSHIIKEIIMTCDNIFQSLAPFIGSKNPNIRKSLCVFVAYCMAYSCIVEPFPNSFFHDIANMKNDSDASVRKSALFTIKSVEMFTSLFENVCFV